MNANSTETVLETAKSLGQPTVGELVDNLVKQKGLKFADATQTIYTEWKKGTLNLSKTDMPSTMRSYLFSLENAWFWAVTALIATTALVIFTVEGSILLYARYALGGVFVLFLPGFMLVSALYPRSEELDGLERAALSIGLSLAIMPLLGLVLNYTPWGIRLEPIVAAMALLVEALAAACVVRRFKYHKLSFK